jgi:hypothetical protein
MTGLTCWVMVAADMSPDAVGIWASALAGRGASMVSVTPADMAMGGDGGSILGTATTELTAVFCGSLDTEEFVCVEALKGAVAGVVLPESPSPHPPANNRPATAINNNKSFIFLPLNYWRNASLMIVQSNY